MSLLPNALQRFSRPSVRIAMLLPTLLTVVVLLAIDGLTTAAEAEPAPAAATDTLLVIGAPATATVEIRSVTADDDIAEVIRRTPFRLIRRGMGSISDLYADGFKRNDITVTIDGERQTTACPNRMDTRAGQVDLLDVETAELIRDGGGLQAGLGGRMAFRRSLPGEATLVRGKMVSEVDHAEAHEGDVSVESRRWRLGLRLRQGAPYADADDGTFAERYGYDDAPTFSIFELRGHRAFASGDVYAAWEKSSDVLFPYLLMDERSNDHYELSASHGDHRLYFNRTEHLMDNDLRTSRAMTDMVTDATNTMVGLVGPWYEVYARNWDADNRITPVANPAAECRNHMLPDVWRIGAVATHRIGDADAPWLFLRAGLIRTEIGDTTPLDMYRRLHVGAESARWSFPLGATVTRTMQPVADLQVTVTGEAATDAPASSSSTSPWTSPAPSLTAGQSGSARPLPHHGTRAGRVSPRRSRDLRHAHLGVSPAGQADRRGALLPVLRGSRRPAGRRLSAQHLGLGHRRRELELGRTARRQHAPGRDPAGADGADRTVTAGGVVPGKRDLPARRRAGPRSLPHSTNRPPAPGIVWTWAWSWTTTICAWPWTCSTSATPCTHSTCRTCAAPSRRACGSTSRGARSASPRRSPSERGRGQPRCRGSSETPVRTPSMNDLRSSSAIRFKVTSVLVRASWAEPTMMA